MILDDRPRLDKKVQELVSQVRTMAIQKGPEAKLPTTRELCVQLKTNSATLNEALEELERQNVIYRKRKSGIFVSPKLHRKTICVLFFSRLFTAEALSPFWVMLWAQFSREMTRRNSLGNEYYHFHLVPETPTSQGALRPEDLPENVLEMIQSKRVHGVLAVGMENLVYEWIKQQGLPSVSFAGMGSFMLNVYSEETVRLAIDDLVAQRCRSIGVWVPTISVDDGYYETPAYREWQSRLIALHLPCYQELFRWGEPIAPDSTYNTNDFQKQGYQLAHTVFGKSEGRKPDGIFITNDLMTNGALAAFDELGVQVGKDVRLASLANAGSPVLANGKVTSLTLIEVDVAELVQTMFSFMERAIMENAVDAFQMHYLHSKVRYIERPASPTL